MNIITYVINKFGVNAPISHKVKIIKGALRFVKKCDGRKVIVDESNYTFLIDDSLFCETYIKVTFDEFLYKYCNVNNNIYNKIGKEDKGIFNDFTVNSQIIH